MQNEIVLSICITSFNRAQLLDRNLKKMLSYKGNDVEFIISDNCSSDDTKDRIRKIEDSRVRFYSNSKNVGFTKNSIIARMKARGQYIMPLNDRDFVNPKYLDDFISFIKRTKMDFYLLAGRYLNNIYYIPIKQELTYRQKIYGMFINNHPGLIILNRNRVQAYYNINYLAMDDRKLAAYGTKILFDFAQIGKGMVYEKRNMVIQPNFVERLKVGQNRKEVFNNKNLAFFLPEVEIDKLKMRFTVLKKMGKTTKKQVLIEEVYRESLVMVTMVHYDNRKDLFRGERYKYDDNENVNWLFVHVKYLLWTIEYLKKKGLLTYKLLLALLQITTLNYVKFIKYRMCELE